MNIKGPIERYWMVHNASTGEAQKRHPTRDAAEVEAKRLAKTRPGLVFYVLEVVSALYTEIPEPWFVYRHPEDGG